MDNEISSFINTDSVRTFFNEAISTEDCELNDSSFDEFVKVCERDFYEWMNENYNHFIIEHSQK